MTKLDCAQARELLLAAVQDRLSCSLTVGLQAHLVGCPACQTEYTDLQALRLLVSEHVETLPCAPDALWNSLQAAVNVADQYALLHSILKLLETMGVPAWGISPVTNALALAKQADSSRLRARLLGLAIAGLSSPAN